MDRRLNLLALQAIAFWPAWGWYARRLSDGSDEPWGLAALVAAAALAATAPEAPRRGPSGQTLTAGPSIAGPPQAPSLTAPAALTLLYAAAFPFAPPLLRAALAVVALAALARALWPGRVTVPVLGLLLLSLPVVPSLQFYLGHPLRVAAGRLAALLLAPAGWNVTASGARLVYGGLVVAVDAPCSGVRMLWAALFLGLSLSGAFRFGARRTGLAVAASAACAVLANAVRASALFLAEAGAYPLPAFAHEGAGLVAFAAGGALVAWSAARLRPREVRPA